MAWRNNRRWRGSMTGDSVAPWQEIVWLNTVIGVVLAHSEKIYGSIIHVVDNWLIDWSWRVFWWEMTWSWLSGIEPMTPTRPPHTLFRKIFLIIHIAAYGICIFLNFQLRWMIYRVCLQNFRELTPLLLRPQFTRHRRPEGQTVGGNHSNPPITIFLALQSSQEHSWALFRTVGGSRESLYKSESIIWTRLILFVVVSDEEFSDKIDYIIWSYLLI